MFKDINVFAENDDILLLSHSGIRILDSTGFFPAHQYFLMWVSIFCG
jgi:hypothetical protein